MELLYHLSYFGKHVQNTMNRFKSEDEALSPYLRIYGTWLVVEARRRPPPPQPPPLVPQVPDIAPGLQFRRRYAASIIRKLPAEADSFRMKRERRDLNPQPPP